MMLIEIAVSASRACRELLKTPGHRVPQAKAIVPATAPQGFDSSLLLRTAGPESTNGSAQFSVQLSRLQHSLQRAGSPIVQIPQALKA